MSVGADSGAENGVSVIIPVYNGAQFLRDALRSVLRQTHPASEILVMDDGSTDDSREVAREFAQVTLVEQANAGVAAARNRAVGMATSPLVAFLDQDDLWEPTKLERQVAELRRQPEAGICVCASKILHQVEDATASETIEGLSLPEADQVGKQIYGGLRFQPSAVMMRREAFLAVGGFDSAAQPCEDWDLWLRLEQAGISFAVVREPLLIYRFHAANESNNSWKMYRGEMRAFTLRIEPGVSRLLRPFARLRMQSRALAGVALLEREQRRPHVGIMLRSLAAWPLGDWRRHKALVHMLLKNVGVLS